MDLTSTNASEAIHPPVLMLQHGDKRVALQLVDSTRICGRLCYATQIKTLITCEHKIDSIRGGVKIENRENLGQCPNNRRGERKQNPEMSQFQFGNFENRRGGVSIFQECPNFNFGILKTEGASLFFKNVPISII